MPEYEEQVCVSDVKYRILLRSVSQTLFQTISWILSWCKSGYLLLSMRPCYCTHAEDQLCRIQDCKRNADL